MEIGHGEDRSSRIFDATIVTLIVLNVIAVVAETVPRIHAAYGPWLYDSNSSRWRCLRSSICLGFGPPSNYPSCRDETLAGPADLARSPALIIDLIAILPFYLHHLVPLDLGVFRMLRLIRFLKLSRYSPAMHTLIRVLQNERKALIGASLLLLTALLFSSTIMYHLESAAQPDKFGSIPESMWWSIATLTTVGYGDVTPVTALGRLSAAYDGDRAFASWRSPWRSSRPVSRKSCSAGTSS